MHKACSSAPGKSQGTRRRTCPAEGSQGVSGREAISTLWSVFLAQNRVTQPGYISASLLISLPATCVPPQSSPGLGTGSSRQSEATWSSWPLAPEKAGPLRFCVRIAACLHVYSKHNITAQAPAQTNPYPVPTTLQAREMPRTVNKLLFGSGPQFQFWQLSTSWLPTVALYSPLTTWLQI